MTENQRLKELQLILGFKNQTEFARQLNITQANLSRIYSEAQGMKVSNAIKEILSNDFNISLNWLVAGTGDIFRTSIENDEISNLLGMVHRILRVIEIRLSKK